MNKETQTIPSAPGQAGPSAGARLMIDIGPLLAFFLTYFLTPGVDILRIITATAVFMVAMIVAMLVSQLKYRHIPVLLWVSAVMVIGFGGLTIWFHDDKFIKIKPTLYYSLVAFVLLFGMVTKRNLLKAVLGTAYPGLSDRGWFLLTRNWVAFFFAMAALNEVVWRSTSFSFWAASKLWLFLPLTFVFAFANFPMLMRHGLMLEEAKEEPPIPPSQ
jgi:intracellular septation protein